MLKRSLEPEAQPEIGRFSDQLIPRLGEPEAQPEIGRPGDQIALRQIGRFSDQLIPEAQPQPRLGEP